SDGARNWSRAGSLATAARFSFVVAMASSSQSLFASTYSFGFGSDGLSRSTDDGKTWMQVGSGLPENPYITSIAVNGAAVYAAVDSSGLYRSTDNGQNWTKLQLTPNINMIG